MYRYEFIETLVRIAQIKYKESKICSNLSEALGKSTYIYIFIFTIFIINRKIIKQGYFPSPLNYRRNQIS
jgi:hypothetical protein